MAARLPLPLDIRPLTSLRFVAAVWVLAFHFRDHLGLGLSQIGLVAHGWLGVDLFFILSGFILAHVYLTEFEEGRFGYGRFLKNRLARVYPMHLAALAAMLALFILAGVTGAGIGNEAAFKLSDLPAHLLMIHAWGATEAAGWNFPSWSISAEWGAYLLFPSLAMVVLRARNCVLLLAGAMMLCFAAYGLLDRLHTAPGFEGAGRDFSQMTAQIGLLRILPSFLLGVALYAFARKHAAPARLAWPIVIASASWVIAVVSFGLWTALAWVGFGGLIYGLAEAARHGRDAPVSGRGFMFLGAASYALYMTHLPVDIVYFHALEKIGIDDASPLWLRGAALAGVFLVCVAVSIAAYLTIEKPAREFVRGLPAPSFKRAPAQPL